MQAWCLAPAVARTFVRKWRTDTLGFRTILGDRSGGDMRTSVGARWAGLLLACATLGTACRGPAPPAEETGQTGQNASGVTDPGALVRVQMGSVVGILLDEI